MSGAVRDGVQTHHFGSKPDPDAAARIADLVASLVTGPPSLPACARLHAALADHPALELADALGDQLRRRDLPAGRVRAVGRWLAEHGTRRDAVAGGIVLLGLTGDERDRDLLLLLGTLEDLTLYAVVALVGTQPDRDRAVFEPARRVAGWGRIQAAERLAGTGDQEIKGWLLRDGFRNEVMTEYLAHLAATTGDLYTALPDPAPDDALLDGAGDILDALGDSCRELAAQPPWRAAVEGALASPELPAFRRALWPAAKLGIPVRDLIRARLQAAPFDGYLWQTLLDGCPAAEIGGLVTLAQDLLPLADLATGPARSRGLGPAHTPDRALSTIVSHLGAHPGRGWSLIRTALRSPVISGRNTAVRALSRWQIPAVPADAPAAVRDALRAEPEPKTRESMEQLLSAWDTGMMS